MSSKVANGNVVMSRFVKNDSTGKVILAGAGDIPCGVSQEGSRNAPLTGFDDGYAAIAGENLHVYEPNEGMNNRCQIESGAAFSNGAYLKPSTNGVAIAVAANNDVYGAVAEMAATAAGQLIWVTVQIGYYGA